MMSKNYEDTFDVIVIGAGHAGCEAAFAAARMGARTMLLTINLDTIAKMSCNPAIGGLAKGQLVREVDALGGEMAKVIDATGIHFKMLNTSKGPAVQSPRAQADKKAYHIEMKRRLEGQENLRLVQDMVEEFFVENGAITGVRTRGGALYGCGACVVTTGTFLRGLIHIGTSQIPGGRGGELPAMRLSDSLRALGLDIARLKTGTPPRINARTINFSVLEVQQPDPVPRPFSFSTERIDIEQVNCYIAQTNERTHEIIRANLDRAPLYTGQIKSIGPRYCPSIEDKIVRFAEKPSHQVFLEPEGRNTLEIYCNGLATSIPRDVQIAMLHTIRGLEKAEIMRYGYAIEYDFVPPTQLKASLETKAVNGLFLAGQINGTSGYEEAAGQGIIAGINAVLFLRKEDPVVLGRDEAYIGVLIDDLVTKGTEEPYRMFTSRAEHRLVLRHDNADRRLMPYGRKFGLISDEQWRRLEKKERCIQELLDYLQSRRVRGHSLAQCLRRPGTTFDDIRKMDSQLAEMDIPRDVVEQVVIEVKYEGYIARQRALIEKLRRMEEKQVPDNIDYAQIQGISKEARNKLAKIRPRSLGQAARISGVSPSDVAVLSVYIAGKLNEKTN